MSKLLIIFGDNTADEIHAVARQFHTEQFDQITKLYYSTYLDLDEKAQKYQQAFTEVFFCIGVVENALRKQIKKIALNNKFIPFTIIHPTATVADSADIGAGCFVAPQAIISIRAVVGDYSIIHFHSSVGHDATLGENVTTLPGARISGEVILGDDVLIGSNAFVFQGVSIGDRTQVDALTYVKHDVPDDMLVSCRVTPPLENPFPRVTKAPSNID